MLKKNASGIILILLLTTTLTLALGVQPAKASGIVSAPIDADNRTESPSMNPQPLSSLPWGDWAHYHNYTEIVNTLLYLNTTFPNIVNVFSIGKSWQNRDIYCIRLTNESDTHPKPKVFFVGYHHAREPISAELPLYFAVYAASNYGTNATITRMLNSSEIYIVPALNVDGFNAVKRNDWQRKNARPIDEDGDGLLDEDPPDDEDGDGYIEDLFFLNSTYYKFIRWEGLDDDGDGLYNEDWVGGVDPNRNYGYQWNATCDSGSPYPTAEDYRGPAPFSEPETQAIRDFCLQNAFKYAVSFHSGAELVLYPWGYTHTPTPNDQIFREVAGNLSALTGAPYEQSASLYTTSGVWDDWMYGNRSALAFTCEIYENDTAWHYEPGPSPNMWWERGIFQAFNPNPSQIETVIHRWLPVFTYVTNRTITDVGDIATTNITPNKTIVDQGFPMRINVTFTNQGYTIETFNATLYANTTTIETKQIILAGGKTTTITFTWNTLGFAYGNYTIRAYAWPLTGETDTTNNNRIDGQVLMTIPGDVNGNFKCDGKDIALISRAYNTKPCDPKWDPRTDINGDSKVDGKDIAIAAKYYNTHYP